MIDLRKRFIPKWMYGLFSCFLIILFSFTESNAQKYSWQKPYTEVSKSGNLEWAPEPFEFQPGKRIRYIDYEGGDDSNNGLTPETAWKHHPWDVRAKGEAAEASGAVTYVFKRGVTYRLFKPENSDDKRSFLKADESGSADVPIRLTSSPEWGKGKAVIAGAIKIPHNWQKASVADVPESMDPEGVWYIKTSGWSDRSLIEATTTLFELKDGKTHDLHIARDPDWQKPGRNFASDYWYRWDGQKEMPVLDENYQPVADDEGNPKIATRPYDESLKGHPCDYFEGGTLWSHWAWFMGTPTPTTIKPGDYNPDEGSLRNNHGKVDEGTRYMIEDLPQFLDAGGEYYYDEDWNGNSGRLFLRLPDRRNPNQAHIEASSTYSSIVIEDQSHIHISGITFTRNGFENNTITVDGNCSDIAVTHCRFYHLANNGLHFECSGDDDQMDDILIADNDFFKVKSSALNIAGRSRNNTSKHWIPGGELQHVEVLRNRMRNTGFRHNGRPWSNVASLNVGFPNTAEIAGNIIIRSFGSALVVHGGKGGGTNANAPAYSVPFTRILVHHNKVEHAAIGVNDYGGLALWQGGPVYCYNNITGNAVGHLPGGFYSQGTMNLSYPLYLDGAFKMYSFNNIIWGRKDDPDDPDDIYTSERAAYFNVFGFMNQFVNNTILGTGIGFGGTSGNRNDMNGNLLVNITGDFINSNHGGNPSLIGGGDDATSGIDGAGTLAYTNNLFYGEADAGTLVTKEKGARKDVQADEIDVLARQMQNYPLRLGRLGKEVNDLPIREDLPKAPNPSASQADLRPKAGSPAIDNGIEYFIPWSLYATVGEWHFNRNNRNPEQILDYHFYMTEAYFHRKTYYKIPAYELKVNSASRDDYVQSPSENWTAGALKFNGNRYAVCTHEKMTEDIRLKINDWWEGDASSLPPKPWTYPEPEKGYNSEGAPRFADEQVMTYPGEYRKTLDMNTCNVLVEASFRIDDLNQSANSVIAGKHDGSNGYQLHIRPSGEMVFMVSSDGRDYTLSAGEECKEGEWHHVLAEIDRKTGRMSIYLDGSPAGQKTASIPADASLSNDADFVVGKDGDREVYFSGALDFLRVCKGTLADSKTTIDELYEWQTKGPVKYDFAGDKPKDNRDVGAIEMIKSE